MLKRLAMLSFAVLSLAVGGGEAGAQSGQIAYTHYFFDNDATLVGIGHPQCYNGNITYTISGRRGDYEELEAAYFCGPNGPEPLE
jgi:hypothetical protein